MKPNTGRTLNIFWSHAKKYKVLMLGMAIALIAMTAVELYHPYLLKVFFDTLTGGGQPSELAQPLIRILLIILALGGAHWIFGRLRHFATAYFETKSMRDLANTCFSYLHKHSYRYFSDNFTGSLVKRVNRMVHSYEGYVDKIYFDLTPLFLKITAVFVILFWINPAIGLVMLVWSLIFLLFNYRFTFYKWKYDLSRAKMDTKVTALLADTITNNPNIKFFDGMDYEFRRFKEITRKWSRALLTQWNVEQIADALQGLMIIALEFLIFYIAVRAWQKGMITVGDFVWIQAYLIEIFMSIWRFSRTIRDIYRALADAEEMTVILYTDHEIKDVQDAKEISIVRGKIEFEKVCFAYEDNEDFQHNEVIHDLSFRIKPGEKVALAGMSGCGKTTITKLMLRLFDVRKGRILIDGQDIREVTQNSLRSQISLVPQDPVLFHRTLMENIRYGRRDASDEAVIAAAKLANCHDFIMSFPEKYNTYVGERGIKLSGGERQRVAIARAILANTPILILDEATSSLDSASEQLIQDALENLMKNKTTLVIAHRFSTITRMDRIIVLQDGRIAENGSHADLIHYKTGLYKKLWDLQVGGYIDR